MRAVSPSSPSISGLAKLTVISRLRYWNRILHRLGISKIHRCWIREGEAWEERRFRAGLVIFRPSQRFPLLKIYEGRARRERAKQTVSIRKLFTITSSHRLSSSPQQRCPCAETTLKRVLYSRGIILGETVELELQLLFFLGKERKIVLKREKIEVTAYSLCSKRCSIRVAWPETLSLTSIEKGD